MTMVYKICRCTEWAEAEVAGAYRGNGDDARDGFIHLSAVDQVARTLDRHFPGVQDLVLVVIDGDALGEALRWERSRSGALYPHLYGTLPLSAVHAVEALPRGLAAISDERDGDADP